MKNLPIEVENFENINEPLVNSCRRLGNSQKGLNFAQPGHTGVWLFHEKIWFCKKEIEDEFIWWSFLVDTKMCLSNKLA